MLTVQTFICNCIEENCHVVWDSAVSTDCWIIDCGSAAPEEFQPIRDFIASKGLAPRLHLLTHAHFDHVWGAGLVEENFGLRPTLLAAEAPFYANAPTLTANLLGTDIGLQLPPIGRLLAAGEELTLGSHAFKVLSTPGHTAGSCCYYCAESACLFSGDTLFQGTCGRTDLPSGNWEQMRQSLARLLTLPPATRVYAGHGMPTTIGAEQHLL